VNTTFLIGIISAGLLGFLFVTALAVLGSPHAGEPRCLKAVRYNIWAEYLALLGYGLLHPRLRAYRATQAEREMPLPGDGLVPMANAAATYAITIAATPERIWPWLLQMGYGKALWYCWSPMHLYPEYSHHVSTYTLHPEWQDLKVGDILLDGDALDQCNETKGTWRVMEMQEQHAIVFYSARDFVDGIEFDPKATRPKQIYGITSWVFFIYPTGEKGSRLLIRTRAELGPHLFTAFVRLFFGLGDAVFERTILEGIKIRVEGQSRETLVFL
jgi:hypothetical protein